MRHETTTTQQIRTTSYCCKGSTIDNAMPCHRPAGHDKVHHTCPLLIATPIVWKRENTKVKERKNRQVKISTYVFVWSIHGGDSNKQILSQLFQLFLFVVGMDTNTWKQVEWNERPRIASFHSNRSNSAEWSQDTAWIWPFSSSMELVVETVLSQPI